MHGPSRIRFEVEKPLGKLAKWLRMLGFDASYQGEDGWRQTNDAEFSRIRLSRSQRPLRAETAGVCIFIESDNYLNQLRQVIDATGILHSCLSPFSRCLRCNVSILPTTKEAVRTRVPDYVWHSQNEFTVCPRCGRIYWPGTHAEQGRQVIQEIFGTDKNPGVENHDKIEKS